MMNPNPASWSEGNERYLAAALAWLRLRLERRVAPGALAPRPDPPVPEASAHSRHWWPRRFAGVAGALELSRPPETVSDQALADAAHAMHAAERAVHPGPALSILAKRLGLSSFEREVVLLCAAMELDPDIAPLCAAAQPGGNRPFPTFALALTLFDDAGWDALTPEGPLRRLRLLEINQPGNQPLVTSALRADERVVSFVKGLNLLDDRVAPLVSAVSSHDEPGGEPDLPLAESQRGAVAHILAVWNHPAPRDGARVVQLLGPDEESKWLVAARAAAEMKRVLYRLRAEALPTHPGDVENLARLWERESLLLPLALYIDAQDLDTDTTAEQVSALRRFLDRCRGPVYLALRDAWPRLGTDGARLDVARPTASEQVAAWSAVLGADSDGLAERLAGQFDLSFAAIRRAAREAGEVPDASSSGRDVRLWDACRDAARPRLDVLAQRLEPKAVWDDLILPDEPMRLLQQIADQVAHRGLVYEQWGFGRKMNRGLGLSVLFTGESGTGKTMAAEVLANALRLHLYRVDLSAVVSKYIGETEKNLRKLFDAAEGGGAILFMDEAEGLFSTRAREVKDSHDRYANLEVGYLLQRMEAYRGLAILATNLKSAIDTAFLRRLRYAVAFPFPSQADRKRMWIKAFPPGMPPPPLDYDRLARLDLTGGHIHTVALNAAFLAAQAGKPLTMPLVLTAARDEFRKLERPVNAADFTWEPLRGNGQKGAA
jgi:AAA+ superfamily predicted ATPase